MDHTHMSKTVFSFVLAILLLTGVLIALQAMPIDSTQVLPQNETISEDGVSVINADEDGISFVLNTSEVAYLADGILSSDVLNMVMQEPGAPELPYFSTYIAVPPEAVISIDVYQEGTSNFSDVSVNAVAEPVLAGGSYGPDAAAASQETTASPQPTTRIPNPAIYKKNDLYPQQVYQLSDPVYFRDMRLVKLDLYPVQYNPLKQELQQTQQMRVNIKFEGAQLENLQPAPSKNDTYQSSIAGMILNFEQGKAWRSLPLSGQGSQLNSLTETAVSLPLGTDSYKIKIDQDGIYDITGKDLADAGMIISNVDPATIQLMSRGEDVAYEFIKKVGGNNAILEDNDVIRFYGEGVKGSRHDKQYLSHNIYWLWANGTPTPINSVTNAPGETAVTTFKDSITREDELYFFATWTSQWDDNYSNNAWNNFPNEADSWYWDLFSAGAKTYTVDIPDPVIDSGTTATYTVEIMTREYRSNYDYQIETCLNSPSECTQRSWTGHRNVNIEQTVPVTSLISGTNEFTVAFSGSSGIQAYLNRITVDYLRALKAEGDQIFFTDEAGGRAMKIQDFGEGAPDNILVWDITSPKTPTQIALDAGDIAENNGRYTYTIGINSNSAQNYIATTTANILTTTNKISQYIAPTNLEPIDGADWIAISYSDFLPEANRLAAHRQQADFGEYKTHVIEINDLINVYGNGLATPAAIQTYLKNAVETWSTKPSYVILVGNASISPRNLVCTAGCLTGWDNDAENFVLTDLQFKGRFQGLIPSDTSLVFLFGEENEGENDLIPDMAIGRITSESITQTTSIVDKIIKYEENLIAQREANQKQRILFLADFPDPAAGDPALDGSFCRSNAETTGPLIPSEYEQVHLCIEDYTTESDFHPEPYIEAIKAETYQGVSIMNYRGHGAFQYWGSPAFWKATPNISDEDLKNTWANNGKPVIIVSADCQDGNFAWPGYSVISERFLVMDDLAGAAAHWGSAGFGYDHEHTVLLEGLYTSIFEHDQITLGDAINYAKLYYIQSGNAESEIYTFNLQGDPAIMTIVPDSNYNNFLPIIIK